MPCEGPVCVTCADEAVRVTVVELLEGGFIDDAAFAQRFADDRRRLDAWGSERIARRLRELGVAPDLVAAAIGEQDREDELEAAIALLRRRVPGVPATPRERDRALGMLVRKGYGLELAHDALLSVAPIAGEQVLAVDTSLPTPAASAEDYSGRVAKFFAQPRGTLPSFDNVDVYPLLRDLLGLPPAQGVDGDDAPLRAALKR